MFFCIVTIDLNNFWIVLKLFLIQIKYPRIFFNDLKIILKSYCLMIFTHNIFYVSEVPIVEHNIIYN